MNGARSQHTGDLVELTQVGGETIWLDPRQVGSVVPTGPGTCRVQTEGGGSYDLAHPAAAVVALIRSRSPSVPGLVER